jgi:Bacterial Ig-like domain (group 3)/FG-GAP-like repeat
MTSQRTLKTKMRIPSAVAPFVAVLTVLIALAAPAQQADKGQPSATSSAAPAPPHLLLSRADNSQRASAGHDQKANSAAASSDPLFLPAVTYSTGGFDSIAYDNSTWVSADDVNGDGKLDVLVANVCSTYSLDECSTGANVGVLLGNGDGTFQPVVTYASGGYYAFTVIAADVNGDGKPDLLVANGCYVTSPDEPCPSSGSVGVLLGNGDGAFQPVINYPSGGLLSWIAVADVNGDGKPDLLVSNQDGGSNGEGSVGVLLNKGDGTFQPVQTYSSGGLQTGFIVVADVNADGKPDLLVSNLSGSVGVLLGNGDGTFQPVVTYAPVIAANVLQVADLRNDGKLDLVVNGGGSFDGGGLSILLGNGDGTFQHAVVYGAGGGYNGPPIIMDLNGDHVLDLAAPNGFCSSTDSACVGVLLGNGDGTFQPAVQYPVGGAALLAAGDVNGDGIIDLITSDEGCPKGVCSNGHGSVNVLLGNGNGTFQSALSYDSGAFYTTWVGTADVNGDGRLDVLAVSPNTGPIIGQVGVLMNNAGGLTATSTTLTSSLNPSVAGQAITFTATVSSIAGAPPNGETVVFTNGSAFLGSAPLTGGIASLTTSSLPVGSSTITALYYGASSFMGSTSAGVRQIVNSGVTTTTLTSSLNPSIYGQKVTWTATVTTSGSVPPTGKVNFNWSVFSIGTGTLNASGVATLTKSNLNADLYPLTAVYSGDANNLGSASPILNQVVTQTTSTATITASPNPSTKGQAVTFTAEITSPTTTPTGPVTFTAGKTTLGTVELSKGKATLTTTTLPVGSTTVTVTYPWNSNISESSASVTQTVEQ